MLFAKLIKGIYNLIRGPEFKGVLSGLRQFLATETPLKMMKNTFYFTLIILFALKILKFLSSLFGHHVERQLDLKDKFNCNKYISQYFKKKR